MSGRANGFLTFSCGGPTLRRNGSYGVSRNLCGAALWARYQPQIFPPHLRREPVAQARLQRQVHAPARAVQRTVQHLRHFDAVAVLRTAKKMHLYVFFRQRTANRCAVLLKQRCPRGLQRQRVAGKPGIQQRAQQHITAGGKPAQTCRS